MSDNICLIMTPQLKGLYNKVWEKYPEQCKRTALTESTFLGWVETYNKQNGKQPDFVPETEALVNNAEKNKNKEGKSFKYTPYTVTYTYQNRKQTYSIIGTHIYNKEGKEVFLEDTKDRRKIFANLAVQQGRAVIVEHKNRKYVVNNRNQIISVTTGDEMKWGEENGDRREILRLSQIAFREKQKAETTTTNQSTIPKASGNMTFSYGNNKRVGIKATTTFGAIQNGERTATTRYESDGHIDYWKNLQVGDIIEWKDANGNKVYVKVTKPLTKLSANTSAEEWSKKEGWSIDYFNSKVKPKLNQAWQLEYELIQQPATTNSGVAQEGVVKKHQGNWSRQEAQNNPRILYVFTDNTDRDSGSGVIPNDSWYSKKYGTGHHFPTMTAAVVRGLDNARPISTQRWYHTGAKGETGRWTDADVNAFKAVIRDELQEIVNEFNTEKYDTIMFPDGDGLFNTKISNISKERTPQLYQALAEMLHEFGFDSLIPVETAIDSSKSSIDFINNNPVFIQFKKDIDLLAGYYEGGGRVLKDDLPNITQELDDKLNDYFMGGVELSIDDYRNLWKLIEFYDDNGERIFRERKPATLLSPSPAIQNNLAANAASLGTITREDVERDNQRLREKEAQAIERAQMQANKPLPERPKSATIESALTTKETPLSKFKRTFSPQQIKDRGAMISDLFSNIIDEYIYDSMDKCLETIESDTATEEKKQEAQEILSKLRDPLKGRQYAAQEKGIGVIANEILQMFEYFRDSAKDDKKVLYQNTIDFFEELFESQASLDIEEREGIRIVGLKVVDKTATEEENEDNDNGDDEVGNVATGSDGWNFKVRYEDPFSRLSKKVRGMLYEVDMPASEVDDLGYQRKYPMGRIYASLLSFLSSNMESADDFIQIDKSYEGKDNWGNDITENTYPNGYPTFPVLEKMRGMYPWVEQIIQRLTDDYLNPEWNTSLRYPSTGGAMASQFYTNFKNVFIPYGKIQLRENNLKKKNNLNKITPLNYAMEDRVQYNKLVANYNNRIVLSPHSIYDAGGKINKENAEYLSRLIDIVLYDIDKTNLIDYIQHPDAYKDDTTSIERYEKDIDKLRDILQSFGIEATTDGIVAYAYMNDGKALRTVLEKLGYIDSLIRKVDDSKVDEFNYILDTRNPYGENMWTHFFDGIGMISDSSYMQSFYDSASHKTKYSYSADNYLMKRFRGICMGTVEQRRKYINENFGKYDWFRDQRQPEGKGWRNAWLEFWYNYGEKFNGNQRELPYKNIDNITESDNYGNVKIRPYVKWEPGDIWEVQERSYDAESKKETAYYLSPIFSDSPMSMTVLGPKLDMGRLLYGYLDNEKKRRQGAFVQLINQELVRIQLVQNREQQIKEGKIKAISNFDTGCGKLFCFLPELNFYTFKDTGESFLDRIIRLKKEKASLSEIEALQIKALTDIIDAKMNEYLYENDYKYQNREPITREQYYNMVYADAAIIQLTTVDLAFYGKGQRGSVNETLNNIMIDFQKRFKEVYAGGIQLNTNSKYGKKAENVLLIKDDVITSPSYTYIANIIDGSEHLTQEDKNYIKSTFTDINVADAQAIRSMHSFRSVFDMMGKWTDEMEQALQHFKDGTWNREDFDVTFQIIKPFVYSVIERNAGNGSSILVPQQNKNSEICALMMYDLISNGLNKSSVYKAFSRFMEDTIDGEGNHLIDMIQYESAGKVGNQGVINISFNPEKVVNVIENGVVADGKEIELYTDEIDNNDFLPNDIEHASQNYEAIKFQLDRKLQNGDISQDGYNKVMQYLRPTEDEIVSMLEQAALITNPDGTKSINEEVVHTIPFDNYYQQQPTPEHHIDAEAVYGSQERNIAVADLPENLELTLPGKRGNKTIKGKDAIIDFYYELLNENLIEDFFGNGNKKGLKGIFESKESLRDAVTEIVRGNPKYSKDFADALKIDPETGKFVLNPNSPTVFTLMQEIITSFFKNRITKQKINGAALIQAAGIGLDESLRIEFDKKGKLLGAHCLMPLTSKRFFEPLLQEKTINGKKVKVLDPEVLKKAELDKAVGYRIPTENKSSMMPLIIDGFTPLQNGSAIVLPAEITNIAGSDFDVDKMFIMLLSFYVQEYNKAKARKDFAKINPTYTASLEFLEKVGLLNEEEDAGLSEDEDRKFNEWFDANKDNYLLDEPIIRKIKYDFSKSPKENSRKARNNMLIQMTFEILRSKEGSESLFNPQGFKDAKRAAKITKVITDPELFDKYLVVFGYNVEETVEGLLQESTKKIEKFINKYSTPESPIFPQTFAHSHARNMAGVNQIGIYAIQASMCAKYQRATVRLTPEHQFTINGKTIKDVDVSENGKRLKGCGQMVGASADNGKDPNLTDMGSTTKTAPIIGYMLRAGLSHLEASLLINQPLMLLSGHSSYSKEWGILGKRPLAVPIENITTEMLIKNIVSPDELTPAQKMAINGVCYRILMQHEAQEYLTQISRADSPNGSIQNNYAKARIQRYKVDLFQAKMGQRGFPFVRINEALSNDAVDTKASEDVVREQLKAQPMAFLHGMYALGIKSFNDLVSPYFFGAQEWFDNGIVKPILYNMNEKDSDTKKEEVVNNIYKSYITYILSGSSLFGNEESASMKSKRDYYLETFPSDYQKIIHENEDIRNLLGNILQVKNFGSRKRVILQDVGSLSKGLKQDAQRRLDDLVYSNNPVAKKLASDLLLYSYFDNGLQFTHDSFSHLFTTLYLTSFSAYTEGLNDLDTEISPEEQTNFIMQFLLTYPNAAYKADKIVKKGNLSEDGNKITFDLNNSYVRDNIINEVMSPNPQSEGINVYPYISYNAEVYVLDTELFKQHSRIPVYNKLERYRTFPKLPLFSRQMSVKELSREFPLDAEYNEQVMPIEEDSPLSYNDSDIDSAVDEGNIYSKVENMDPFSVDIDPSDFTNIPETKTEKYENEGNGKLQDPFCK